VGLQISDAGSGCGHLDALVGCRRTRRSRRSDHATALAATATRRRLGLGLGIDDRPEVGDGLGLGLGLGPGIDDRLEVIVRFLAVLELYKQGIIDVDQVETFGDLTVRRLSEAESLIDVVSMDDWDDGTRPMTPEDAEIDAAEDAELDALVVSVDLS